MDSLHLDLRSEEGAPSEEPSSPSTSTACDVCGKTFTPSGGRKRCGDVCHKAAKRRRDRKRKTKLHPPDARRRRCVVCEREFQAKNSRGAVCGKDCLRTRDAQHAAAYRAANPEKVRALSVKRVERVRSSPEVRLALAQRERELRQAHIASDPHYLLKESAKRYGLTLNDVLTLLASQDNNCAICGQRESGTPLSRRLFIDHDHATGRVRGLLCHHCNAALGGFRDDPARLRAAIVYLAASEVK